MRLRLGIENVDYREVAVEALAVEQPAAFDVVTCMEMLEHVPDPASVVRACAMLVKPGGQVFFSTINRNAKAFLFAIVGAEHVLNLLPKGTHEYAKFIRPSELAQACRDAGLQLETTPRHGVQPVERPLLAVGQHQCQLLVRLPFACAMSSATRLVLFDLDGTLIDSAPDLAAAANAMRLARSLEALPLSSLRPMVGSGARGMVGAALGIHPGDASFESLRQEFLDRYQDGLLDRTAVFADMVPVLEGLEAAGTRWGIVTNKAERFAWPVIDGLRLSARAAVVICGDTTPHSKPHPAPLLEAARRVGVEPSRCVYVGDDLRDVQAGRAASMLTLAAAWGYLGQGESIDTWGAHAVLAEPAALLQWLQVA